MYFSRLAILLLLLMVVPINMGSAEKMETYSVSVSELETSSGEVIVSFAINVTAGAIQSVVNIPVGWYLAVDNDASWQTKIKANTIIGAASLSVEDLRRMKLIIKKNEFMDLKFGLSGIVCFTKDYKKERQLSLRMTNFSIRKWK
jgi:hypothetical protein